MELSYCVVNTDARDHLLNCLGAIRRTHPRGVEHEVIVLDNASTDGSVEAVREVEPGVRVIGRDRRAGLAENNSLLLHEARGRFCLLLNEDSEILEGATEALLGALRSNPDAAAAGAQLLDPRGRRIGCAWRLPGVGTALAEALHVHRWLTVQIGGTGPREVGWVQSAAMLVRRDAAEQVDYLDSAFFVYFEEVDCQKRLRDRRWRILHVPAARAIHHQQLTTDRSVGGRRVVEFHRMRDLYMRKHHSAISAALVRLLAAWTYSLRALGAVIVPGRRADWYWLHARQALRPGRGEGMREAADAYNTRRASVESGRSEEALTR